MTGRVLVRAAGAFDGQRHLGRTDVLVEGGRLVAALRVEGITRRVVVTSGENGFDHALGPAIRLPPLAPGLARAL